MDASPSSDCLIRPAAPADETRVWALLRQFATTYAPSEPAYAASYAKLLTEPDAMFLVAVSGGEVVGYLLGFELPTLFANGPILQLTELVVDEHRRGAGLGRKLVEDALVRAWDRGCMEVVVATRRAAPFYERLGFARSAEYLKLRRGSENDEDASS